MQKVLLVATASFALLVPAVAAHAQDDRKQVLVLYSTRRDAQFSIVGETELPRALDNGLARNLDYYSEFIDLARSPEQIYRAAFRDFLRQKYRGVRFDLVVALQDTAVDFIDDFRDELFPDTPVVFLANRPQTTRRANSAGFILERNYVSTVALIRRLQPDLEHIFVVTGAAATDKVYEDAVRRQMAAGFPDLAFTYLSGLATAELEARLSRLPARSAVYYVLVNVDGAGERFHPLAYLDRIATVASAPLYSWVDSTMNHGIVGGSLYSQAAAIGHVGALALRVLGGESADAISMVAMDFNGNQVDWRQLRRWGLDEGRLPPGTMVRFREASLWDNYRLYVVSAVALLITQSALISGLLIQRRRRRRAEAALHDSHARNRDLATRLLRAQETERARIARELHDDICQRMLLLTIELEAVERTGDLKGPAGKEAVTIARDVSKSLHELSHQLYPTRLRLIGLVDALHRLCVELSDTARIATFTPDRVPEVMAPDVMLCLFRVAQEAIQNAVKYSNARHISVRLSGTPNGLTLAIVDDGTGFDVSTAWGKGIGLMSMLERLEAIGGLLEIVSAPGAGTRVIANVPAHAVVALKG